MLEKAPSEEVMTGLIGEDAYVIWKELCNAIEEKYDMERLWNTGGKSWNYEYKYRRGGKTLCALYVRENCFGFMVIFGKEERAKFEKNRMNFSDDIIKTYEEAKIYHDGKWMMFYPESAALFPEYIELLKMKRPPNKKKHEYGKNNCR